MNESINTLQLGPEAKLRPAVDARPKQELNFKSLFEQSEVSLWQEFAEMYGHTYRYDHSRKRWLIWDGHRWRRDTDKEIHRAVEHLAKARYEKAWHFDGKEREPVAKFALKASSAYLLDATVKMAQHQKPISATGSEFDRDAMLLGVANGVVDLRDGKLRPGKLEDLLTKQAPIKYDPEAKCPRWEQFLCEIFKGMEELIPFIHRAIGYSLTGEVGEQVFFLLHGRGSNGKSTLLDTILAMIGSDYAATIDFDALIGEYRQRHQFDLANIEGRRFVVASEFDRKVELSSKVVKTLVGNGRLVVNEKYKQPREVDPTHKLWLACNDLPTVTDRTPGFWRRVHLIPFDQTFPVDKELGPRLLSELEGILAWAVRGSLAWRDKGLAAPTAVKGATDDYREQSDSYHRFIKAMCVLDHEAHILPDDLKTAYERWQAENQDAPQYGRGDGLRASLLAAGAREGRVRIDSKQRRALLKVRLIA